MKRILFFASFSCFTFLHCQNIKSCGGIEAEGPNQLVQLPDSGFVIQGFTRSFGPNNQNAYTIRTNSNGDTLWTKALGNGSEGGVDVLCDSQYIYLLNSTSSFGPGACDIEKRDFAGNLVWAYGYSGTQIMAPTFFCDGLNGSKLVLGYDNISTPPYNTIVAMTIDSSGNVLWYRRIGGNKWEYSGDVKRCNDGGFIICGKTSSFNNASNNAPDAFLLRLDANGDSLWMKRYEVAPYQMGASSVLALPDGGFALAGAQNKFTAGVDDLYLVRTDSVGDTLWTRTYGGSGPDYGAELLLMPDSGFLISAQSGSFAPGNNWEIYLVRTDMNGDTLWTATMGGLDHDVPRDIIHTYNGGIAILSQSASWNASGIYQDYDAALIMFDSTITGACINGPTATTVGRCPFVVASCSPMFDTSVSGIRSIHTPNGTSGGVPTTWCNPLSVTQPEASADFVSFPNPADDRVYFSTTVQSVHIHDVHGRIVLNEQNKTAIDITALAPGLYFILADGVTQKLVIAR